MGHLQELTVRPVSIEVRNESVDGIKIKELRPLLNRKFVISRIKHREGGETELVDSETVIHVGDIILVISTPIDVEAITIFFGKEIKMEWEQLNKQLISRRILITKPELNGKTLSQLKIRNNFGAALPASTVREWTWLPARSCSCKWATVSPSLVPSLPLLMPRKYWVTQ